MLKVFEEILIGQHPFPCLILFKQSCQGCRFSRIPLNNMSVIVDKVKEGSQLSDWGRGFYYSMSASWLYPCISSRWISCALKIALVKQINITLASYKVYSLAKFEKHALNASHTHETLTVLSKYTAKFISFIYTY